MGGLRTLIDQASAMAESRFDPAEPMMPHFIVEERGGGIAIYALAMHGADLDRVRRDLELRFRLERHRRWVLVAESWLVEYDGSAEAGPEPVDHPCRIEVVAFDGFDMATDKRVRASRQIVRTAGGAARLLPLVVTKVRVVDRPAATHEPERS